MGTLSNDVIFYLRGDSKKDISINSNAIITDGNPTINMTEPSLSFNGTNQYIKVTGLDFANFLSGDYTVEFEAKHIAVKNQYDTPLAILAGDGGDVSRRSIYTHWVGSGTDISFCNAGTTMASVSNGVKLNTWHHIAFVRSGNTTKGYLDGVYVGSTTTNFTASDGLYIGTMHNNTSGTFFYGDVKNVMITKRAKYSDNFTPQFDTYTSITVDDIQIINSLLTFSINKSDNEDIIKIEILSNDKLIHTIDDNFNDIQYDLNTANIEEKFSNIKIKVYYLDGKFVSAVKDYINISLTTLDNNASIVDIKNTLQNIYEYQSLLNDTLYNILTSEGFVISNEDKRMGILIAKVDEYTNIVKEEFEDIKEKLVEALIKEKIDVSIDNSFDELISKIKNITDFPSWVNTSGGYWITGANITTARRYLSSGVVGTNIYCIGGYTGSSSSLNHRYDTLTNTWTTMTAMTASRYGHAVTASKGKIYAMGGYSSATTNYCYDPSTNAWTTMTAVPSSSYYSATAEVDGIIYLISGYVGGSVSTTNRTYDVSTNTWSTISVLPAAVYSASVGVYKNKIYVVGGYNGGAKTTNYCYDITNGNWTTLQAKTNTVYRAGQVAPVIDGKLYVIGGTGSATYSTVNECYDIENNTWSTVTVLPTGRWGLTTQEVNGFIYCIGGYTGSYTNINQCFIPM